ncbi:uncharacterized protein LOC100891856 [Strongylocentrotus purpuratus]|uniref:Uncharacterized protein n=1 Tax=Strongylocentrotus purpuratus TaxID=7668 RepID=A0A7M7P7X6_STRPU|nr:uncharacterized protein LOC100891856 [Strongylocentrotus purpuratus]
MWQDNKEPKEILVKLMDKFDLICDATVEAPVEAPVDGEVTEVSNETEKEKKCYYVPSRLKAHRSPKEIPQIKSTDFYVDFGGFLPDGLFHRLMTRAVRWKGKRKRETVKLFYRQIQIPLDNKHQAYLEMLPPPEATIKVTVFREVVDGSWDSHQPPAPNVVKKVSSSTGWFQLQHNSNEQRRRRITVL